MGKCYKIAKLNIKDEIFKCNNDTKYNEKLFENSIYNPLSLLIKLLKDKDDELKYHKWVEEASLLYDENKI